jgi:hypothetical protein
MNTGAVIAGRQNRYMRRFQGAGATNSASARTLEELGCRHSFVFSRLVDQGVFVEVSSGRYYIDIEKAKTFRSRRRMVALMAVGIAVVTILVLFWMR